MYDNNFDTEACRRGADFVPYSEEELSALRAWDSSKGLEEWVLPEPIHPTFWKLLEAPEDIPAGTLAIAKVPALHSEATQTDAALPDDSQLPPPP